MMEKKYELSMDALSRWHLMSFAAINGNDGVLLLNGEQELLALMGMRWLLPGLVMENDQRVMVVGSESRYLRVMKMGRACVSWSLKRTWN